MKQILLLVAQKRDSLLTVGDAVDCNYTQAHTQVSEDWNI